jgi:malonyl-CoA O-methyltransferase
MRLASSCALSFTRAARSYDAASDAQKRIVSRLGQLLSADLLPQRVLELGCGTGALTGLLRHRFPEAWIDAVDLSIGMVEQARVEFGADPRIEIVQADAREFVATEAYDLIASSSAMHWMEPLDLLFERLAGMLRGDGELYCSLMLRRTLFELHHVRNLVAPSKSFGLELPTADMVEQSLDRAGFRICSFDIEDFVCKFDSVGDLLKNLHDLGVNSKPRKDAPLSRGELRKLEGAYRKEYLTPQGYLPLTFQAGFFRAKSI